MYRPTSVTLLPPKFFQIYLLIITLSLLIHHSQALTVSCKSQYYGTPSAADCNALLKTIADPHDNRPRLFDEEQLRTYGTNDFPGVQNNFETQVVQVPAYWSLRTCNIAIFSYAESLHVHVPLGVSSWQRVHDRGNDMIKNCLFMGRAEGGSVVIEHFFTNRPTLSLFMWESGSYFDGLCNEIQNDPAALSPGGSARGLMAGVENGTSRL